MTNHTTLNVEGIARGLTKAQREFLLDSPDNYFFVQGYRPGDKLVSLGVLERQRVRLSDRVVITDLGLAVRAALLKEKDHG